MKTQIEKNSRRNLLPVILAAGALRAAAETVEQPNPEKEHAVERKQGFTIDVFTLDKPMHVVGRSVRVTHGTPECFPTIHALWKNFKDDDALSKIPGKKEPVVLFGISTGHHVPAEGLIEFTYILGVEVEAAAGEDKPPETMRHFTIPAGDVARARVSAPDGDTALGIGYVEMSKWRADHPEWEDAGVGETEVYVDESPGWVEFEKWDFVKRREPPKNHRITDYDRVQPWQNFFLASAVASAAKAAGAEETNLGFYAAFTGDTFAHMYPENPDKPGPCDSGITSCFFTPETVKLAFTAFGRECVYFSNADIKKDFRGAMNAIQASVDKGIPVVAYGMGNVTSRDGKRYDPLPEGCLIGGYDGDVLLVNLYMGPDRLPEGSVDEHGYSRIVNGLDTTRGIFIVGEKMENHDMRGVYETAVNAIPGLLRRPAAESDMGGSPVGEETGTRGYVFGKAAFEKWADTLETDSYFEGKTDDELAALNWMLHGAPYCNFCTGSWDNQWMETLAARYPDWTLVARLVPLYGRLAKGREEIWNDQGGFGAPMETFKTHEHRAHIATILRRMGGVCDEILKVFEEEK